MKTTYQIDAVADDETVEDMADTAYVNDPWVRLAALQYEGNYEGTLSLPEDLLTSWDRQRHSRKRRAQRIATFYTLLVAVSVIIVIGKSLCW